MTSHSQDSTLELHLPSSAPANNAPAELEGLVVELFDQNRARLSSYVLGFGLPHPDAEDIVQETFLSLFHHLERGRPRWNLHGWLFRVAHNLALKRRTANRSRSGDLDDEARLAQHPDPAQSAEDQFAFHQTQRQLQAVFDALPERDRRCLQLRAEGLKYREIAKVLGISLGAVSQSLSRSLARMNRATGGNQV